MFRMWVKEWKDNHMIRDITICDAADPSEKNRTKKVFDTLEEACYELDVAKPIWSNGLIRHAFQRTALLRKCRLII